MHYQSLVTSHFSTKIACNFSFKGLKIFFIFFILVKLTIIYVVIIFIAFVFWDYEEDFRKCVYPVMSFEPSTAFSVTVGHCHWYKYPPLEYQWHLLLGKKFSVQNQTKIYVSSFSDDPKFQNKTKYGNWRNIIILNYLK